MSAYVDPHGDDILPGETGKLGYANVASSGAFFNGPVNGASSCRVPLGSFTSDELERLDAEAREREERAE